MEFYIEVTPDTMGVISYKVKTKCFRCITDAMYQKVPEWTWSAGDFSFADEYIEQTLEEEFDDDQQ